MHRISNVDDAFRSRFAKTNRSIETNIIPKRAELLGQIVKLDNRLDEVKSASGAIEKDIRSEYAAIMD